MRACVRACVRVCWAGRVSGRAGWVAGLGPHARVLPPCGVVALRPHAPLPAPPAAVAGPVGYGFIMWMEGNIMTAAPHRCRGGCYCR